MQRLRFLSFLLAALAVCLSACASDVAQRDTDKLALYRAHAGAPVDKFRYFGTIDSWTPLGDEAIAVWTRPNEAWLLDLTGRCPDITFSPAIGITNTLGQVYARLDKVIVYSRSSVNIPCHIRQIRPLDVKAIREGERRAREAAKAGQGASGT